MLDMFNFTIRSRNFKNIFLGSVVIFCCSFNISALQHSTAIAITATAAAAGGFYFGIERDVKYVFYQPGYYKTFNATDAARGAVIVGGAVGLLARRNTAAGLLRRAKNAFPCDPCLVEVVRSEGLLIPLLEQHYIRKVTPLADSFKDLTLEHQGCEKAQKLLDRLDSALKIRPSCAGKELLESASDTHRKFVTTSKPLIEAALQEIRRQPTFLKEQRAISAKDLATAAETNAMANTINAAANIGRIGTRN
ncbi:MAG TPA: hypothetical protein VJJ81_02770 [Candidatus Babeliales bacterium]|nr:hypothetical protein [Candidatus Babeliales bacterium]